MTIGLLAGMGVGLGALLIAMGARGTTPTRPDEDLTPRRAVVTDAALGRVAIAAVAAVVAFLATGWIVGGVLVGLATSVAPWIFNSASPQGMAVARTEAVASWVEMIRDTMAAAAGIEEAITSTAEVAPLPIRGEVQRLAARLERERFVPTLRAFADELADPTADLVVTALVLATERQARDLTGLLDSLARSARAEASMRLRVDAGRSRARTAVRVVTGTTVGFALLLVVFSRDFLSPYDDALGQAWLMVVGLLFSGAIWKLDQMAEIPGPPRLLGPRLNVEGER